MDERDRERNIGAADKPWFAGVLLILCYATPIGMFCWNAAHNLLLAAAMALAVIALVFGILRGNFDEPRRLQYLGFGGIFASVIGCGIEPFMTPLLACFMAGGAYLMRMGCIREPPRPARTPRVRQRLYFHPHDRGGHYPPGTKPQDPSKDPWGYLTYFSGRKD